MKYFLSSLFAIIFFMASSVMASSSIKWQVCDSCSAPESIYYDQTTDTLFVSNIVGKGDEKDGKGWISKLTPQGKTIQSKWVSGLNAPKGMRSSGDTLWVTDIDEVVEINIKQASVKKKYPVPGAKFLNDIAIGEDRTVYISDSLTSTIYQLKNGKVSVFMRGDELESPNGLIFKNGKLYVAAWGLTTDWSTKKRGRLYTIDIATKKINHISKPDMGNLDGLEIDQAGNFILSDWVAGKVFKLTPTGEMTTLYSAKKGTADIAIIPDKNLILVPEMVENQLTAIEIRN